MSTRSVITVRDDSDTFHVYKHWDGYPSNIANVIAAAATKAWPMPRFEAADFAAALVAANKEHGGDVYFSNGPRQHGDLDYRYEVTCKDGELRVAVWRREYVSMDRPQKDGASRKNLTLDKLAKVNI